MRAAVPILLALVLLTVAAGPASAGRTLTLTSTFQGQSATASFAVPGDWKGTAKGSHVGLTAPSSRKRCRHLLRLDLGLLYVASTVTAPNWITSRLTGHGPVVDRGDRGDGYSWGAAARKGRRASLAYGALVVGSGRLGRIMAEVRATSDLAGGCAASQAKPAARRLTRVVEGLTLRATAKR